MHGSLRKGYFYAFVSESLENPLSKLMLDKILVNEFLDLAYQRKIEGAFSESLYKSDKMLRVSEQSLNLSNSLFSLFNKELLNSFRVGRVTDRYWNEQGHPFFWQIVVCYDTLCKLAIGNYNYVIWKHPYPCCPPCNVINITLLSCLKPYKISNPDSFFKEDMNSSKEICQCILKCKGNSKTPNT